MTTVKYRKLCIRKMEVQSGDLQETTVEYANGTRQTIQLWDQFRVWDPGD